MDIQFYTKDGKVNKDLYDSIAFQIANYFIVKDRRGNNVGVSNSQIRKIFNEVKRIKRSVNEDNFEDKLPLIMMIKSKTAYNVARAKRNTKRWEESKRQCYDKLYDFVKICLKKDKIQKLDDYNLFCNLFEAVYGFYYELGGYKTDKQN